MRRPLVYPIYGDVLADLPTDPAVLRALLAAERAAHAVTQSERDIWDHFTRRFYERAKKEGWGHYEIDASHNPHITCPDALMALLTRIMPNTWADK